MSKHDLSRRDILGIGTAAGAAAVLGPTLNAADVLAGPRPQVPRRTLGKTGEKIPILLLGGAVSLDPRFDPKIAEALDYGVNYIDAADCYGGGTCEAAVASFVTKANVRDKVWITSKSDEHDPGGFENTLHASLRHLQTDVIDMYYLHAVKDPDVLNKDLLKVVERAKRQGKIKYFGFSCHAGNVDELLHLAAKTSWVDSVMFRYNFRQYGDKALNKAIDAAHAANVGLIAMKTQGSATSFEDKWKKVQTTGKWTKHQAVLKAVWQDERITASVSHMDSMKKLRQNIAAAVDKEELGAIDRKALYEYADATRHLACDGCDQICGAAVEQPVQIGATMRYLMYHDVYGEPDKARALYRKLPESGRPRQGVDFAAANAVCPHGIDVAAHMRRAATILA